MRIAAVASAVALAAVVPAVPGAAQSATQAPTVAVANDNLGTRQFTQPGATGKFRKMPVRLQGVIAAPTAGTRRPLVLIAHGAHGDNCAGEFGEWPCYAREQRNDRGLRYLARSLAAAGFVAVVPDVNGAYTGGWGEPNERLRFQQIMNATIAAVATAGTGGRRVGVPLAGRVNTKRIGILGHSRGGMNAERWSRGRAGVRSVFLLAPAYDAGVRPANRPTTLVLGTCDGDTGDDGAGYPAAARRLGQASPWWQLSVTAANHNDYNATLVRLGKDDATSAEAGLGDRCAPAARPGPAAQQAFLAQVAADHFRRTLLGAAPAAWQAPGVVSATIAGLAVVQTQRNVR